MSVNSGNEDITEIFPLGPCAVHLAGVTVGHTDESGAKLTMKATIVQTMAAKYGKVPVGAFLDGQSVEVDFILMQNDMTLLGAAFAGATIITDGSGNKKITFGQIGGTPIPSVKLELLPYQALTPNCNWTMQAFPEGDFSPVYEGAKWAGYKCKFVGVINEAGAANNSYIGQFGLASITTSVTAPAVSAVVPANAATGVSVSASVVATVSLPLNPTTVNTQTVTLIEDPVGTPVQIAGAVSLVNNGASTTVTFKPTVNLPSGKAYSFLISETVLGSNGVGLVDGSANPGFSSHFAT